MGRKCHIFSVGVISSLGTGNDEFINGIQNPSDLDDEITEFEVHEDSPGLGKIIRDFNISDYFPSIKSYIDKCTAFGLKASYEAIDQSVFRTEISERIGLIYASQFACINTMSLYGKMGLDKGWRFAPPFLFIHSYPNTPAAMVHIELGLKGFSNVFSGSQKSGELAIADAISVISSGKSEAVLAGGVDVLSSARYNDLFLSGTLGTFDQPLENQTPGEAAAFLLMGQENSELAASASKNKEILGTIEVVESLKNHDHDYYFIQDPKIPVPSLSSKAVDIGLITGRCAAASLPLSICAFLLSDVFSPDNTGIFPIDSIPGHFLKVEKRK